MIDFDELFAAIPHEQGCDGKHADDPDIGWCFLWRMTVAQQIKKLDRPEEPPYRRAYQSGDRVLISWGMGDYDHGTVVKHVADMVMVEIDKPSGGWYHSWISDIALRPLREEEEKRADMDGAGVVPGGDGVRGGLPARHRARRESDQSRGQEASGDRA